MINKMIDEETLLLAARNHQRDALIEIYDMYQAQIYAYAYRTLMDIDLAEECTAATFQRLLESLQKGKGPKTHLRAYLYRIAHNWMMDTFRASSKVVREDESASETRPDENPSPMDQILNQQTSMELQERLGLLTAEQREVLVLRFVDEYSLNETAVIINKPAGAVKSLQNRALTNLRKYYLQKDQDKP